MLKDYLRKELIFINPDIKNKQALFKYLAEQLENKRIVTNKKIFFNSLVERENLGNTELQANIAIPHAHCSTVNKLFLAIVTSRNGIEYGREELGPVKLLFLVGCSSSAPREYIKLLAAVARITKIPDIIGRMASCSQPEQVLQILKEHDFYDSPLYSKEQYMMKVTLYNNEILNDVLAGLIELGVNNASIVSSTSLARLISYNIPVFAGLKLYSKVDEVKTNTVFAVISDKSTASKLYSILKDEGADLENPGNGYIKIFKVKEVIGHADEL